MSQRAVDRLRQYVGRGGHLFASFETSLYDESGIRRPGFALADVFGISGTGRTSGPKRWDLMKPSAAGGLLEGIQREVMPSPRYYVRTTPHGSDPVLMFMKPLGGPYEGMPEVSEDPTVVIHRYGRGEAVYSSGDLGSAIHEYHMAEHLRIVANAVRRLAPPPVEIENAPRSMEITLRSQDHGKRLLLHLVNFTGEMSRPIQHVIPIEKLNISLRLDGPARKIFTLMHPQVLKPVQNGGGKVSFVLPKMDEYEVVVIERESSALR